LNVSAFEDPSRFKNRVDGVIRQIQQSSTAPGFERVYPPGHLEAQQRYRQEGIPLNPQTLAELAKTAKELDVDASALEIRRVAGC